MAWVIGLNMQRPIINGRSHALALLSPFFFLLLCLGLFQLRGEVQELQFAENAHDWLDAESLGMLVKAFFLSKIHLPNRSAHKRSFATIPALLSSEAKNNALATLLQHLDRIQQNVQGLQTRLRHGGAGGGSYLVVDPEHHRYGLVSEASWQRIATRARPAWCWWS